MTETVLRAIKRVKPSLHSQTVRNLLLVALAVIGLIDASYITVNHYAGTYLSCSADAACDEVLNSEFSTLGPIPISAMGLLYYLAILGLAVCPASKFSLRQPILVVLTGCGLAVSAYLIWLQAAVLHSFCNYCMLSAAVCLLLFATAIYRRN
jgi:uncharacterized membrane protein